MQVPALARPPARVAEAVEAPRRAAVADRLNEVALERGEQLLGRYGGRISSEWYFPKLIELWLEDRELYDEAHAFVEATDWIVWWLTGSLVRQSCTAGYKALWSPDEGLPLARVLRGRLPGFRHAPARSSGRSSCRSGRAPGRSGPTLAQEVGLPESVAVAVGNVDSFVSFPGCGVEQRRHVRDRRRHLDLRHGRPPRRGPPARHHGGRRRTGSCPGLYGYEAGQVAVGDMLAWYRRARWTERRRLVRRARAGRGQGRSWRDRAGRARLVERQPLDPRRRRPQRRDRRADAAERRRPDLPRAARVDRVRQPADRGQLLRARARDRARSSPAAGSPSAARC